MLVSPGFRATIFFLAVVFRVMRDGLSERETTRSLSLTLKAPRLKLKSCDVGDRVFGCTFVYNSLQMGEKWDLV